MTAESADAGVSAVEALSRVLLRAVLDDFEADFIENEGATPWQNTLAQARAVLAAGYLLAPEARPVEEPEHDFDAMGWWCSRHAATDCATSEARPVPVDGDGLRAALDDALAGAASWQIVNGSGMWALSLYDARKVIRAVLAQHTADPEEPS